MITLKSEREIKKIKEYAQSENVPIIDFIKNSFPNFKIENMNNGTFIANITAPIEKCKP